MKSALETLNPTRVKLTVEVPFGELEPSLKAAYKKISSQVQVPGFRRGKVPPRLIDQRFGRAVVLEEAVNDALPKFYGQAVRDNEVAVLGQPEVEVTQFDDGQQLTFTAEVDIRPDFEIPAYDDLQVAVDDADVTETDVDEQLTTLRERFGALRGVDRPAQPGDFLSIDLSATVGGEEVESVSGMSYEVGTASLLEGLDQAVQGMSAGDATTFTTELAGGDHAGQQAQVSVTVNAVKERELPDLDDEFAQTASEFDTLEELREDVRTRIGRMKKLEQGIQARDRALEALLARIDLPLPEALVQSEVEGRMQTMTQQLEQAGLTKEQYLETEEQDEDSFTRELEERARDAIKAQFVLEKIATKEQLQVSEPELTQHLVRTAQRYGMPPEEFANQVVQAGQVQMLVSEVVRGKALALVLDAATVTDASGRPVDLEALREEASEAPAAETVEISGDAEERAGGDAEDASVTGESDLPTGDAVPAQDARQDPAAGEPEVAVEQRQG